MANPPERMQRRHVRDKATIDHLVQDVYKPKPLDEQHASHSLTTSTGLPVEDQVPRNGTHAGVAFRLFDGWIRSYTGPSGK